MGRALKSLRDEDVFIIGSGMTYHNLRAFTPHAAPIAEAFDEWLREAATLDEQERTERLTRWVQSQVSEISGQLQEVSEGRIGREETQRHARLVAIDAIDLPAADEFVDDTTLIQITFVLTKRQFDKIIDHKHVWRAVWRYRSERLAIEWILQHATERRSAE